MRSVERLRCPRHRGAVRAARRGRAPADRRRSDRMTQQVMPGDRPIRLALVGCGRISRRTTSTPSPSSTSSSWSPCATSSSRARAKRARRSGVPWFTSYEQMLAQVPSDAVVIIATPSGLHPQHGIMAAQGRPARDLARSRWRSRSPPPTRSCRRATNTACISSSSSRTGSTRRSSCSSAPSTRGASGASTWPTAPCAGRVRRSTTTRRRGAAPGSSTAARS